MTTGIVTCGDVTDATPAGFYAHTSDRDSSAAIFHDLASSPVQLVMGSANKSMNDTITNKLKQSGYNIVSSIESINQANGKKWLLIDSIAGLSMLNGRGTWLQDAFAKAVNVLLKNKAGFFLMIEGAQADHGGHNNSLPYVVTEVLDFDQTVGKALEFADKNGETLVIVTADHETGGLTLLDGDYTKGYVSGQFLTNDHTAIPVPVFAYGPQSDIFRGVYENTELFNSIMTALQFKHK
jgi:alkaline phosphatase